MQQSPAKTHRGLRGRVEQGKSGGGLCYGYDVVKRTDDKGEPIRGERRINEDEAETVRRIFKEFAAGVSPRTLARRLNAKGIPGPSGALWTDSTLRGHANGNGGEKLVHGSGGIVSLRAEQNSAT